MELNVTTRKSFNEILDKQIKRYSKKGWHTKWNLWNSTRFDFKIKNSTTETRCCGPESVIFTDLC